MEGIPCSPFAHHSTIKRMQRQEYKQLQNGHSSRLNYEKVEKLDKIGFVWEAQRGRRKLPDSMAVEKQAQQAQLQTENHSAKSIQLAAAGTNPLAAAAAAGFSSVEALVSALHRQETNSSRVAAPAAPPLNLASNLNLVGGNDLFAMLQRQVNANSCAVHPDNSAGQQQKQQAAAVTSTQGQIQSALLEWAKLRKQEEEASSQPPPIAPRPSKPEGTGTTEYQAKLQSSANSNATSADYDGKLPPRLANLLGLTSEGQAVESLALARGMGLENLVQRSNGDSGSSASLPDLESLFKAMKERQAPPSTSSSSSFNINPSEAAQFAQLLRMEQQRQQQTSANTAAEITRDPIGDLGGLDQIKVELLLQLQQRRQRESNARPTDPPANMSRGESESFLANLINQSASAQGQQRPSQTGLPAGPAENGSSLVSSLTQGQWAGENVEATAMTILLSYANCLPEHSPARAGLKNARTVAEAQNILRQDIMRQVRTGQVGIPNAAASAPSFSSFANSSTGAGGNASYADKNSLIERLLGMNSNSSDRRNSDPSANENRKRQYADSGDDRKPAAMAESSKKSRLE